MNLERRALNVERPGLRLGLTLALGALGAWWLPVHAFAFQGVFGAVWPGALWTWLAAALTAALLVRFLERAKGSLPAEAPRRAWRLVLRGAVVAVAAPLLLFAARPTDARPAARLTRLGFALFPFALAAGCPLVHVGYDFCRPPEWVFAASSAFGVWAWLGCALLFVLNPWPEVPGAGGEKPEPPWVPRVVRAGTVALAAMALVPWATVHEMRDTGMLLLLLLAPTVGGGLGYALFGLLTPWPACLRVPKLGELPAAARMGPLGTALFLGLALVPFAIYAHRMLFAVVSGKLFAPGGAMLRGSSALDQSSISTWLFRFTLFAVLALPYVAVARWLSDRRSRLGWWAFALPTLGLGALLVSMLTCPFWSLLVYIATMGFTLRRMLGVVYGLGAYVVVVAFMAWALRPNSR